jgi:Tfp pilus assembly protein PilN
MINLIPKEQKKKMTVDFYYRLAILFLLLGSFCVFVATAALLPAYFISAKKNSIVNAKLQIQKDEPLSTSGEQSLATVKDVNSKLGIVESGENNQFVISTKIIDAVISDKTPGIQITQISYQNDPTTGRKVTLVGIASTRAALLSFEQALQNDPGFKNVDLPISNFVKESDLQFDLTFTPA